MATESPPPILNACTQPAPLSTTCYSGHFSAIKHPRHPGARRHTHVYAGEGQPWREEQDTERNAISFQMHSRLGSAEVSA